MPDETDAAADEQARDLVVALARRGVTATTSRASRPRYGHLAIDSNLPDVRIVVADRPNAVADALAARVGELPDGDVVFVPAARPLRDVWVPNADLRELDALPAVVLRDVEAAVVAIDGWSAHRDPGRRRRAWSRTPRARWPCSPTGCPGFAVDPDGGLNLSLMRSCTGWPSGVWIDPPRRTAPDGSSFQLQHWTHEFAYALVSHGGDWREATLPAEGQAFSAPLLAVGAEPQEGPADLPATHSLLQVRPRPGTCWSARSRRPATPSRQGTRRAADPRHSTTIRLVEASGDRTRATVTLPDTPALTAATADLLEVPQEQLP